MKEWTASSDSSSQLHSFKWIQKRTLTENPVPLSTNTILNDEHFTKDPISNEMLNIFYFIHTIQRKIQETLTFEIRFNVYYPAVYQAWTRNYSLYILNPHFNLDAPTVYKMQDANAVMQAHLVRIELLIRKDCLLITHLFLKKKMHNAERSSFPRGKASMSSAETWSRRATTQ